MRAVITAGGRVTEDFSAAIATDVKALAPLRGKTLLRRAIDAARDAGAEKVAVVGGSAVRESCAHLVDDVIEEANSGAENVRLALSAYPDHDALYLSSDLPYVSGPALLAFLHRVPRNTLAIPVASARAYEHRFPGASDHTTKLGAERIANGSVFFIPRGAGPVVLGVAQRLFDARKSAFRMGWLLGPALLAKFVLRRLCIHDIEVRATQTLGIAAAAVRDCAPELCFDVDTLADYRYAVERS